jgi:hypothetical protein
VGGRVGKQESKRAGEDTGNKVDKIGEIGEIKEIRARI